MWKSLRHIIFHISYKYSLRPKSLLVHSFNSLYISGFPTRAHRFTSFLILKKTNLWQNILNTSSLTIFLLYLLYLFAWTHNSDICNLWYTVESRHCFASRGHDLRKPLPSPSNKNGKNCPQIWSDVGHPLFSGSILSNTKTYHVWYWLQLKHSCIDCTCSQKCIVVVVLWWTSFFYSQKVH